MSEYLKIVKFIGLVVATIIFTYYLQSISTLFYLGVVYAYYKSKDEPFWLAYFLVVSDGFFGFFGMYAALLKVVPGLPGIELAQFYFMTSVIKAINKRSDYRPFYWPIMQIVAVYVVFLVVQGYVAGISMALNVQFRLLKWLMPLLLFYSLPKLMNKMEEFRQVFVFLFPVAIVAFIAQVFTITMSQTPLQFFGLAKEAKFVLEVSSSRTYRGSYNDIISIITVFGAFFFLAHKEKHFKPGYLFLVIAANFASAFLSATRGFVISYSFVTILAMYFAVPISPKRMGSMVLIITGLLLGAQAVPILRLQINNAFERVMTVKSIAEGDMTAGGTLVRMSERSPRVMGKWKESPLTGWGFSNDFMHYQDEHVGNQNILMQSGIIGYLLMLFFFGNFLLKIYLRSNNLPADHAYKKSLLIFCIFFMGWFLIHSTSQQLFFYYLLPANAIIQALFFTFGGFAYHQVMQAEQGHKQLPASRLDSLPQFSKS